MENIGEFVRPSEVLDEALILYFAVVKAVLVPAALLLYVVSLILFTLSQRLMWGAQWTKTWVSEWAPVRPWGFRRE